jgi:hypothetical protein
MSFFVSALVSLQALRNEYRLDFLVLLYQDKRTIVNTGLFFPDFTGLRFPLFHVN